MDNLAVPHTVKQALQKADLYSLESVLEHSNGDLMRKTGLTASQVEGLVQISSEAALGGEGNMLFTSSHDKYKQEIKLHNWGRVTTGCPVLDKCLEGGILPAALTEIAGTSGAGKTQVCLQLSLMAQLPTSQGGLDGQSVFILTEGPLPSGRLKQLSLAVAKRFRNLNATSLMDNVLVHHCIDVPSLTALLRHKLPMLLDQNSCIKMLLIDSIAALFRSEYDSSELSQRSEDLKTIISLLQNLIYLYKMTIVCTNQVTASDSGERPALGLTWSSSLTVRLVLQRNETVDNEEEFQEGIVKTPRILKVEFAPHITFKEIKYFIDNNGVFGINEDVI